MELNDAIRRARERAGVTQVELASSTGLSQSRISALERGVNPPSIAQLDAIEDALGIERGTIIDMTGRQPRGDDEIAFMASQIAQASPRTQRAIRALLDSEFEEDE